MADSQSGESNAGAGDRWALLIETDAAYRRRGRKAGNRLARSSSLNGDVERRKAPAQ
jgi:hypothetical protein